MDRLYRKHIRENLLLALDTLRTHKFRSFLTVLGVLIGTMTVIAVASVFAGLDKQVADAAKDFGTRTLFIFKFQVGLRFRLSREERLRKPLTYEDARAIQEECPAVETVAVEKFIWWGPPDEFLNRHRLHRGALLLNCPGVLVGQRLAQPLLARKAETKAHLKLEDEQRASAKVLRRVRHLFVEAGKDGRHRDHRHGSDQHAKDGQERTELMRPQG